MTNHAFGRGTVAVPVKWIDSLVPHARVILQAVRLRNRTRTGKADFSGQHCVEFTLYLVRPRLVGIAAAHAQRKWHDAASPQPTAANLSMPTASSSNTQARAATSPRIELEAQVGLSSGLSSVHEAVDEWFTGLHGFPAPPLLCEQAIQRGQRLSKKAIDNLSRRRDLHLRIQALATDRCWPLKKALAV
ncbi:hypothetical protein ABBQ32_000980 [Trebouxia sp. C0010 RCD-2024]